MQSKEAATVVPVSGRLVTSILQLVTISVLAFCLTRRIQFVKNWGTLTLPHWLILAIYIDSFGFIFCTAVLSKSWSLNSSADVCEGAILLCLICYMTTKILIYYFLVEKVFIIRGSRTSRFKNKLWLFNFFGVICPYTVLVVLNFVYRIAYINGKGVCIIGMKKRALVPLISFDVVLNVYLTSLFLHPLRQLYSYKHNTNTALKRMAFRTFIGSCSTLILSVTNLSVLTILDGEPGWICLMLCNLDILFSVLILHWVTSIDRDATNTTIGTPQQQRQLDDSRRDVISRDGNRFSNHGHLASVITNIHATKGAKADEIAMDAVYIKTHQVQEFENRETSSQCMEYGQDRHGSEDAIVVVKVDSGF